MKDQQSYVFSSEEIQEINNMRQAYESLTEREKFIVKEALKVYFYMKK
jgi:hypothetical protein